MLPFMKTPLSLTLINGAPNQIITPADRGLAYGDGLFETIKLHNGSPCLLEFHQERLYQGLARLKFSDQAIKAVQESLNVSVSQLVSFANEHALPAAVMKWVVTRGVGLRGYNPEGADQPSVIASVAPYHPMKERNINGVSVFVCDTPLARNPFLSGLKHLNRLEQVLARAEWQSTEYAEGLMLDTEGHVVEGTMSNLFWVKGGEVFTPDLTYCGIEGTLRRFIIQTLNAQGQSVHIVSEGLNAIKDADEVFVCNSLIGIWPVTQMMGCHWDVGPTTLEIQKRLDEAEV
jgi:4-amino-4-deoxychorismate lyase